MKFLLIDLLILFMLGKGFSQTGSVKGTVKDKETGELLTGATILLKGSFKGASADLDGNFVLNNMPVGEIVLECSFVSYQSLEKSVNVVEGKEVVLDFELETANISLGEIKVVARANRESEALLLLEQKDAPIIKSAIGAVELSIQGVSDAAGAATKMTGINKQFSSNTLFVRGLGDRYNSTTLNGLPLPSNNAELKNIDLKIFSSDIIEYVGVEKVFTPNMYGDFAGGNINIATKKFVGDPFIEIGAKVGANLNVLDAPDYFLSEGTTLFGFENFKSPSTSSTYTFINGVDPVENNGLPDMGLSITGGNSLILENSTLHFFSTFSFENAHGYGDDVRNKVNGSDFFDKRLSGEKYSYSTQSLGMINLNLKNINNSYFFNSLFSNTSDHELSNFIADYIKDVAIDGGYVRRSGFERTRLYVNQFLGEHDLNAKWKLNWGMAYNMVSNVVPDRRDNILIYAGQNSTGYTPANNDNANNKRYFHELDETEMAGNISVDYKFGRSAGRNEFKGKLTAGYSVKQKNREFSAAQFNYKILNEEARINEMNMDDFFGVSGFQRNDFELSRLLSSYNGELFVSGVFGMIQYNFGPKLLIVTGIRAEQVYQSIGFKTILRTGTEDFVKNNLLPSLSLKYGITDKSNLRLAYSTTYTLPQFKESALFLFEGITESTLGNPYLYPSTDYNGEAKWEYFPYPGELFSVALFRKYIKNPINNFVMASATNEFTYANTGDLAKIGGIELEMKKDLFKKTIKNGFQKLSATMNTTIMYSEQELDRDKIIEETEHTVSVNFNKDVESLQGAAPFIANANIYHQVKFEKSNIEIMNSIVYGYVSNSLALIGYATIGNQVENSLNMLDYNVKCKIGDLGLKFSVKNLLNPEIVKIQENSSGDFVIKSENQGVRTSIELSYKF